MVDFKSIIYVGKEKNLSLIEIQRMIEKVPLIESQKNVKEESLSEDVGDSNIYQEGETEDNFEHFSEFHEGQEADTVLLRPK